MLILGAKGNLGREIAKAAPAAGWLVTKAGRAECDITDRGAIRRILQDTKPDLVISAAAMTRVDQAERDPDRAFFVNSWGSELLARACRDAQVPLVSFSSDFVFDGRQRRPYCEEDEVAPLSQYGRSKLSGDRAVLAASPNNLVVRVGNLYGSFGRNLPARLPALLREGPRPKLDSERIMAPTWSKAVAEQLLAMLSAKVPGGLYHVACHGETTWADFGQHMAVLLGIEDAFDRVSSSELGLDAPRPSYSVLRNRKLEWLGLDQMPDWRVALETWIQQLDHHATQQTNDHQENDL